MSKETLKHTMRSKVRVFEDGGIRLLRKGQKGLIHAIFSRFGLVLVLLVLQFGALFSLMRWFSNLLPHYLGGTLLVTAAMMVYLLNQDMNNSVRIPWLVVTALAPVLGVLLFCYTKEDVGHRVLKKRLLELEGQTRSQLPQPKKASKALDADCPGAASLAQYLRGRGGGFPVYENTQVTYFPSGEAKFAALLPQLESATQYIFLEYFIIDEGLMWGRILEILARKAAQGVDVRVMYDGTCEFSTLPRDYPRRLEALGIRCKVFAPVTPFVSTHYNYRDHRKILVVDGRVGFTGGVNLADEYINHVEKYGRWKDAAIMLEGEGVRTMTALFCRCGASSGSRSLPSSSPAPSRKRRPTALSSPTATARWTASGWVRWSISTCSTAPGTAYISSRPTSFWTASWRPPCALPPSAAWMCT